MEASYSDVWAHIGTHQPFPNSCRCTEALDNGAGLSWSFSLPAGGSATYAHRTVFSPTGVTGGQGPAAGPVSAFGPGGVVVAPSNRRCVSRRNFRIRLRHPRRSRILGATVKVNGRTVSTRRGRRVTAPVDLRGLPRGRFTVSITVLLTDGGVIRGQRRYRTCVPRRTTPRV